MQVVHGADKAGAISLIDGHAHLNELSSVAGDLDAARAKGVVAIIAVGMDIKSNIKTMEIAGEYPGFVFPAIGYHPWEIRRQEIAENLDFIEDNIGSCIALGEVGLDYKAAPPKDLQKSVFKEIIGIASRHSKPLILHCRYSHKRALTMISEGGIGNAVFHWYSGPKELTGSILAEGYYFSATPALRHSFPHRNAIAEIPLERLLIETDCPVSHEGRPSRPGDVTTTLKEVSLIKGISEEKTARILLENTTRFYGIQLYHEWN